MLFLSFSSQEERRKFGGSCFMELQYCRLKKGTKLKKIVSVNAFEHWKNDSLYIRGDDMDEFFAQYSKIFDDGICYNGECGVVDLWGTNYYTLEQTTHLMEILKRDKPKDYQVLLNWLEDVDKYNGFYLFGV